MRLEQRFIVAAALFLGGCNLDEFGRTGSGGLVPQALNSPDCTTINSGLQIAGWTFDRVNRSVLNNVDNVSISYDGNNDHLQVKIEYNTPDGRAAQTIPAGSLQHVVINSDGKIYLIQRSGDRENTINVGVFCPEIEE